MSKARVPLYGRPGQHVDVETDPQTGAVVGVNLTLPDGTVVTPEMILNSANPGGDGIPDEVYWRTIRDVPPNLVAIALLVGTGFAWRNSDGTWQLRRSGRATVPFSYGDAASVVFTASEDCRLTAIRINVDTAFDGAGAVLEVGTLADQDAYMTADDSDPAAVGGYEVLLGVELLAGDQVYLTINPGAGGTAGAGNLLIDTIPLSES